MIRVIIGLALIIAFASCGEKEWGKAPEISFEIFPFMGDSLTTFHIDLTHSKDQEDLIENLLCRFDWNSDGIWDTDYEKIKPRVRLFSAKGMHYVTAEVLDPDGFFSSLTDSLYVFPPPDYGELRDTRDGQIYKTVRLENRWWMAEHLRYGERINSGESPENNGLAEYFLLNDEDENLSKYGGLYSWDEAMDYYEEEGATGICPSGWHIPTAKEWKLISQNYLWLYYFLI